MYDQRYGESGRLQREYIDCMDAAYKDRDLNGSYTKEGLRQLAKAALCQQKLVERTQGAAQNKHREEYDRLYRLIREECARLGVVNKPEQKAPTSFTTTASPSDGGTANPPSGTEHVVPPTDREGNRDPNRDEVGEGFNINDFILPPGKLTLDDATIDPELARRLKDALDSFDPKVAFPNIDWPSMRRSNFLFFGPPGTGKSYLCSVLNGTMKAYYPGDRSVFLLVDANKLVSKWRGSTGHRLDAIFAEAERHEFSIICIDEFEQLCPDRTKVEDRASYTKNFLTLMEGVSGRTSAMIIACTNHPQLLDPAILSRLENRVFIDYPGEEDIYHFFADDARIADCLGETREAAQDVARALAERAAKRRFSYRNLNTAQTLMVGKAGHKTREAYPEGNAELSHMVPLSRDEAMALLEAVDSDYDPEQYRLYADYLQKKGDA